MALVFNLRRCAACRW